MKASTSEFFTPIKLRKKLKLQTPVQVRRLTPMNMGEGR